MLIMLKVDGQGLVDGRLGRDEAEKFRAIRHNGRACVILVETHD